MEVQKVRFLTLTSWTLPPIVETVTVPEARDADLRWGRNTRVKGACWPYKMGKQAGWTIRSPLDLHIEPVRELQVQAAEAELEELGQQHGIQFWVRRGSTYIGVAPDGWFRFHQARVAGQWRNLLIPNGECTFEWALGWGLELPEDHVALFQPIEGQDAFVVHPGLLPAERLATFTESGLGLAIAFEPRRAHTIKRGDPLAKLFVFHKSALALEAEVVERGETTHATLAGV